MRRKTYKPPKTTAKANRLVEDEDGKPLGVEEYDEEVDAGFEPFSADDLYEPDGEFMKCTRCEIRLNNYLALTGHRDLEIERDKRRADEAESDTQTA